MRRDCHPNPSCETSSRNSIPQVHMAFRVGSVLALNRKSLWEASEGKQVVVRDGPKSDRGKARVAAGVH